MKINRDVLIAGVVVALAFVCAFFVPMTSNSSVSEAQMAKLPDALVTAFEQYNATHYLPFKEGAPSDWVEAFPMDTSVQYSACYDSNSIPNAQRVLVAVDVAECGESMSLTLADGSKKRVVVAGILYAQPFNTVRFYGIDIPQVVKIAR